MSPLDAVLLGIACLVALNALFWLAMFLWKRSEKRPVRPAKREEWEDIGEWEWPSR